MLPDEIFKTFRICPPHGFHLLVSIASFVPMSETALLGDRAVLQ